MKKLKIILLSNYFYAVLVLVLSIYLFNYYNKSHNTNIDLNNTCFEGYITDYKIKDDKLTIEVKGIEKIIAYYCFNKDDIVDYNLGDYVYLEGTFKLSENNTVFKLYNYKNYLKSKNIYITMNVKKITKLKNNNKFLYDIKNLLKKHISKYKNADYLETFILGNNSLMEEEYKDSYIKNGISHLMAISGMHITFLGLLFLFVLNKFKLKSNISLILTSIFLIFYLLLIGVKTSAFRSVLLFVLLGINKSLKLNVSTIKILILTAFILLFLNPFYIYDIGFIYSYVISFYLIFFKDKFSKNYFMNIFIISLLSFIVSIPITLYNSYEINLLSIIFNIFYVPFISLIVFPFSIITLLLIQLDGVFGLLINVLEQTSFYFSKIDNLTLIVGRLNIITIILYYLFVSMMIRNKKYLLLIILLLVFEYNKDYILPSNYVIFIDVKQGDSILIHKSNKTILIDTGGIVTFGNIKSKSISKTRLIPLFKSLGIRKINDLIISHGDYDHAGETINLVNNFRVEKVIFNCDSYNELENEIKKILNKKKINHYSCISKLDDLYFLNTKEYDNENDNSNVIYTELNDYKFMFMGDAGIEKEKDILEKYNLSDIDVLKVGHHGSKTSSFKEFINEINPKYSIISVGKNNRYGHPNKEVLNNLEKSKIYRTDQDGSIMFKIKNNKLKMETCSP